MKKIYFNQTEISEIIAEETHTIRYWETIFPQLQPKTVRNGRRVYTEKNIKFFLFVKKLIRDDKLSNTGVKEQINLFFDKKKLSKKKENFNKNLSENQVCNCKNSEVIIDSKIENLVTFTKEEFSELLQIIQMMILLIKSK